MNKFSYQQALGLTHTLRILGVLGTAELDRRVGSALNLSRDHEVLLSTAHPTSCDRKFLNALISQT